MLNFKNNNFLLYKLDAINFLKKLPSNSIDLIVTDPAYSGMNNHLKLGSGRIVGQYKKKGEKGKWFKEFEDTRENYSEFLSESKRVLKKNSHIYIMFDSFSLLSLGHLVREYLDIKNIIVWDKAIIGMGHYFRRQSEFIIFSSKGKKPISNRSTNDVWKIKRISRAIYPTQKPVELFSKMIFSSKLKNEKKFIVCDPFSGSASAGIAALKNNCNFIGCDISKKALHIGKKRLKYYSKNKIDLFEKNKTKIGQ
jgi:site-specific DNA-methyltransferase (adenine-specific)